MRGSQPAKVSSSWRVLTQSSSCCAASRPRTDFVRLSTVGLDSALQGVFGTPAPEVIIAGNEGAEEKEKVPKEPTLQEKVKQAIGLTCRISSVLFCWSGLELTSSPNRPQLGGVSYALRV